MFVLLILAIKDHGHVLQTNEALIREQLLEMVRIFWNKKVHELLSVVQEHSQHTMCRLHVCASPSGSPEPSLTISFIKKESF